MTTNPTHPALSALKELSAEMRQVANAKFKDGRVALPSTQYAISAWADRLATHADALAAGLGEAERAPEAAMRLESIRRQVVAWMDTADWDGAERQSVGDHAGEASCDTARRAYAKVLRLIGAPSLAATPQPPGAAFCPGCGSPYRGREGSCHQCGKGVNPPPTPAPGAALSEDGTCPRCGAPTDPDYGHVGTCSLLSLSEREALERIDKLHGVRRVVHPDAEICIAALRRLAASPASVEVGPCAFCGEPVDNLAGNPSRWPLTFSHPDGTGESKLHHVGCVVSRLFPASGEPVAWYAADADGNPRSQPKWKQADAQSIVDIYACRPGDKAYLHSLYAHPLAGRGDVTEDVLVEYCDGRERRVPATAQRPKEEAPVRPPNPGLDRCNDALTEQWKPKPAKCANCGDGPCWFPLP